MSTYSAREMYSEWMCADLTTECPECEMVIAEPSGCLETFLDLLDRHRDDICVPFQLLQKATDGASHEIDFINYDEDGHVYQG